MCNKSINLYLCKLQSLLNCYLRASPVSIVLALSVNLDKDSGHHLGSKKTRSGFEWGRGSGRRHPSLCGVTRYLENLNTSFHSWGCQVT